jgi:hypothetical protein
LLIFAVVVPIRELRYSFVTLKNLCNSFIFVEKSFGQDLPDEASLPEDFLAALKLLRVKN